MEIAKIVIEYLRVILSPQVVISVTILIILMIFQSELQVLLKRIAKIKFPNGTEISTSQIERSHEELSAKGNKPEPLSTPSSEPVSLPSFTLTQEELKKLEEIFAAERARAALWEYRYLNHFLAFSSQCIPEWLASLNQRTTIATLHSVWLPTIPNAKEREAIIQALEGHYLISLSGELIDVTPKGKEYLQWRGPLSNLSS